MDLRKYFPCACGSGKVSKNCCYGTPRQLNFIFDTELFRSASKFPVYECLINSGWEEAKVAHIFLVRQMPNFKYLVGAYMVDLLCLGLITCYCDGNISYDAVRVYETSPDRLPSSPISYEDARSLILGAIDFAKKAGFKPDLSDANASKEDAFWPNAKHLLEPEKPFERIFSFGVNGKPVYIEGSYDDDKMIFPLVKPKIDAGLIRVKKAPT